MWDTQFLNPTYAELGTTSGSSGARKTRFTLTHTRTLTVTNLQAGGSAGITYVANGNATLPGANITNYVTAYTCSGGESVADDSAALTWELLALGDDCGD